MNNKELLEEIHIIKNHDPKTQKSYLRSINKYSQYHEMTMEELIEEAENEEEQGIRWKRRKLKKRLLQFRQYLIENYKKNTVTTYFTAVIVVYRYFEIEIGDLTRTNPRGFNIPGDATFDELPTHKEISQVLHAVPLWFQAVILFQTSSGCARKETADMTIGAFKKATYPFHHKTDIVDALNVLKDLDNVIPTFKLKREKTNKYYYTFCSPEAVSKIVEYLLNDRIEILDDGTEKRIDLDDDDKLFNKTESYIPVTYCRINDEFQFGKAGDGFNRFRSHMMRKFHSNHLKKSGMSESDIDALQGRTKSSTRAAYFLDDPTLLLKKYVEHYQCLLIEKTVNNIDIKSPEYLELEHKYKEKEAEVDNINARMDEFEKRLRDIDKMNYSDDELLDSMSQK